MRLGNVQHNKRRPNNEKLYSKITSTRETTFSDDHRVIISIKIGTAISTNPLKAIWCQKQNNKKLYSRWLHVWLPNFVFD